MKKVLSIIGIVLVLLIGTLVALPFLFKDKIVQLVKEEANKNLNAKVDWGSFDLTIISTFPNFSFTLNDLKVVGIDDFKNDTLISLKSLDLRLNLMSVIKGEKMEINGIVLNNPRINAIVLKDGKANWDITKPSADTVTAAPAEPTKFQIGLKRFAIINGYLVYDDKQSDMYSKLVGLNHELKGDFTQDIFDLITETTIDQLTYGYGGVNYFNKLKTGIKATLTADMPNFKFTFKENEFALNALVFGLDGYFAMPKEDMDMDLKFNAKKADFKEFLSLVPGSYTKDFENVKTSGKLAFDGYAKGIYNDKVMPAFGITLLVENAMFQYPSLPKAVKNINIDLKVDNKTGNPDNTVVDIRKFHVEMGSNPVDVRMLITTPVSDANIDGTVKGKLNLAEVKDFVPMEGTEMSGTFTADIDMKGRMSAIEKEKYDEFKASGNLKIENMKYKSADLSYATEISGADMSFTPQNLNLSRFNAKIGKSDISFVGIVDNYMAYVFKDELLHGRFNFNSNYLNIDELMGPEETTTTAAPADTAPMTVVEVPSNLDVELVSDIKKMDYDKLTIYNTSGTLKIKDSRMDMSGLKMMLFDGILGMTGYYDTKNIKRPAVDMQLSIEGFDIPKSYAYFNSVQKLAPAAKYAKGKFNTIFNLSTVLDSKMEPDYNSLNAYGKLQTVNVVLSNHPALSKIADQLKQNQYKNFPLNNVDLSFKVKDGKVEVEPFDIKIGNSNLNIAGVNYLDQKIDYKMVFDMPRSELGSAANGVINGLVAQAASQGVNANVGERIKVNALVTGTASDPKIKLDLKDQAKNMVNDLKDQAMDKAKAEADKLKAEAEAKVRAEADKIKTEAEAKVKAEADKIKAEAEAKAKEAEAKMKAEIEKKKKEAEEKAKKEAEKKLKGLFGK
jgi:uncharacterized protein involved in outer membrane biogenesis